MAHQGEQRIDVEVCVDCLVLDANGPDELDSEYLARVEAYDRGGQITNNCPEGCEGWFSWESCDGCGSTLGGDRHPAVLWITRLDIPPTGDRKE